MSGDRRWADVRWTSLCRLLLMGLVVAGLFAMHGLQASDGPMDSHGLPLMSMASGPHDPMTSPEGHLRHDQAAPRAAQPAHERTAPQAAQPVHERAGARAAQPAHERAGAGPRSPVSPTPHHPGGRTCLGLLLVASLLILLTVLIGRSALRRSPGRRRSRLRRRHGGRPPPTPSVFQLSVLRL
ncbi:hypothetical protein [Actinoallomurus vinaceus]|uniref:hypothetical protein n=1 Tax=Actinoallomurus vinaceus TaxID=1080074 RepID=UPI0031E81B98